MPPFAGLNPKELTELEKRFKLLDANGDHELTEDEFCKAFGSPHLGKALFQAFDVSKNGRIDLREFIGGLSILSKGSITDRLHFAFRLFDVDSDGKVTLEELKRTLHSVDTAISILKDGGRDKTDKDLDKLASEIFAALDADGDGFVTVKEFVDGLTTRPDLMKTLRLDHSNDFNSASPDSGSLPAKPPRPTGNLAVSWGHPQWAFVIQMMLGMKIANEKANEKPKNAVELEPAAFKAQTAFEIPDTQLVSTTTKYKFVDFAPEVFRRMRKAWNINEAHFREAVGPAQIFAKLLLGDLASLTSCISAGKSGSLFFYTPDNCFLAKTIPRREFNSLMTILPKLYHYTMDTKENSLLMHILALHSIHDGSREYTFVVLSNVLNTVNQIDTLYDLKGSTLGRQAGPSEKVQKDLNIKEPFPIDPPTATRLYQMIKHDSKFLEKNNLMDYSLLLGVHKVRPGTVRKPNDIKSSDGSAIYYIGIIDYLTDYNVAKWFETTYKAMTTADRAGISAVPSSEYGERFRNFMKRKVLGITEKGTIVMPSDVQVRIVY